LLILLNLAAAGAYGFFLRSLSAVRRNVEISAADVSRSVSKVLELESLESFLEATAEERQAVESSLIGRDGVVEFVKTLERLGRESGLEIRTNSLSVSEAPREADLVELLTVNLEGKGGWRDTIDFLSVIEQLPFSVSIGEVSLAADSAVKGRAPRWVSGVQLSVFKLK